jgi:protein-disulfide isomerase
MLSRRSLVLAALAAPLPALAAPSHPVPIELFEEALELEAGVRAGHPSGDVTMVEFFDFNCPYCRQSARDLPSLLRADPDLAYVLVNFATLGPPSIEATRVALGFVQLHGPSRYLALHQRLFALRGIVDGRRALAEAEALGAERDRLVRAADSREVTGRMREALRVGNSLGIVATPSFVIGPELYTGALDLEQKRVLAAKARA